MSGAIGILGLVPLAAAPTSLTGSIITRAAFVLMGSSVWLIASDALRNSIRGGAGTTLHHIANATEDTDNPLIPELKALGMRYLGTFEEHNPDLSITVRSQMYIDEAAQVTAAVTLLYDTVAADLQAHLTDGTILQVTYPIGRDFSREGYVWRVNKQSVTVAYHQLRGLIEEAASPPTRVSTPADAEAREAAFQEQAGDVTARPLRVYGYAQTVGLMVFTTCFLWIAALDWPGAAAAFSAGDALGGFMTRLTIAGIMSMIGLAAPFVLMIVEMARLGIWRTGELQHAKRT